MRGHARLATYVGRTLMVVGFAMIVIAWDQASRLDYIQGQFPYLLSGAIPGLAFIVIGAGLEYVQHVRQATARRARQMAELNLTVVKLIGFVRDGGGLVTGPDEAAPPAATASAPRVHTPDPPAESFAPAPRPAATATAVAPAAAPAKEDPGTQNVIAGRSSFHVPDCHLVTGRDDMATITRLEAEGQGLSPCRVCKP